MDDLMEAGRRLRSQMAEPTPPVSEIYRRSNRRHRRHLRTGALAGIVLVAATAGALVAVLPSSHRLQVITGGAGHDVAPAAAGTAVVTLTLDQRSVVAGQPISGVATIDNNTGKPIPVPDPACQALVTVELANASIHFTGYSDLMLCPAVHTIPVGVSRQPITVATTYNSCSQDPAQVSSRLPACVGPDKDVMPPLPPGTYHTVASVSSPFKVEDSVSVRLTGPTGVASTATTGVAASVECSPSHLRIAAGPYGEAGGSFTQTFIISDTSATSCRLQGWPKFVPELHPGQPDAVKVLTVRQTVPPAPAYQTVLLHPGGAASFDVFDADYDAARNQVCPKTSAALISLPGSHPGLAVTVPMQIPRYPAAPTRSRWHL